MTKSSGQNKHAFRKAYLRPIDDFPTIECMCGFKAIYFTWAHAGSLFDEHLFDNDVGDHG